MIGVPRTGKTTFTENFARNYKKAYPNRKIVWVYPYITNNIKLTYTKIYNGSEENLFADLQNTYNSLIIFDDIKQYDFSKDQIQIEQLAQRRGHYGNDILCIYHTFLNTPPRIITSAEMFYIFRTNEVYNSIEHKLPFALKNKELIEKKYNSLPPYKYYEVKIL